ncbi:MAG: uroporphyrinogen decarboxylase [candidate division WOR-3 bacterium]
MKTDFINACLRKKPKRVPVFFLRQAGRYIPEYLKIRTEYSMEEIIKNPLLSAKVVLLPFKYFDLDSAIIFSDLLVILWGFGIDFELKEHGPKVKGKYVEKFSIKPFDFLKEQIKILKKEIDVPLIGFTAAPFTLLSYIIEGEYKRDFPETRKFIYRNEEEWIKLIEKVSEGIKEFLMLQADSGCDAVMLFDSWAGALQGELYSKLIFPYTQKIFESLKGKIRIYFSISTTHLITIINGYSCEVIGIDWRIPLHFAIEYLGKEHAIQGNLDPAVLFSNFERIKKELEKIKEIRKNFNGFIFSLGHGVLPETPVENLKKVVDEVHKWEI